MVAQLDPAKFNRLLSNKRPGLGQNVSWRRSFLCPCRSFTSGSPQQGCPICGGRGVAWDPAIPAWTALAGMKIAREWALFGLWQSGDVVISIPEDSPLFDIGENDRVDFPDSSQPFSIILMGGISVLPFPIKSISRVVWKDPGTHLLVTGGIPTVGPGNVLSWGLPDPFSDDFSDQFGAGRAPADSIGPPDGVQYSISGQRIPQYWMFRDLVQDRHHHAGLRLPRRVALRAFDLFGQEMS